MADEINFIDLACLLRITPDTTLEKFGSAINSSTFDAANLAGTLKQKSLIEFSSYYPGPNTIVIADAGKALITEADLKAVEPLDNLDEEILFQVSGGKRLPIELQNTLNVRSKDLALHIYKLFKQGLVIYELKSGMADLQLTEGGFIKARASTPKVQPKPVAPQPQMQQPMQQQMSAPNVAAPTDPKPESQPMMPKPKSNMTMYAIAFAVVVVLVVLYYLFINNII